jgi:hypothetical protein
VARVRAFDPSDLDAVVALLGARLPSGPWTANPSFLSDCLVDDPGLDPELPSLVAVDDAKRIVGFIASQPRSFTLGDRPVRGVLCSHLVVAEEGAGAAAALLLRTLLSGPQEFTFTDTALDAVTRAWRRLGGIPDPARSSDWMLALGPGRFALRPIRRARAMARAKTDREEAWRRLVPIPALPLQAAGPRAVAGAFPEVAEGVESHDATAAEIAESGPAASRGVELRRVHEERDLAHSFRLIESTTGDAVVRRVVRREGAVIGWYAFQQLPGGTARALSIAAPEPESDSVLADLIAVAGASGNSLLVGRVEPHLVPALGDRLPALGLARRPLIHARDPEIALALVTPAARLSLLDGEWWA